MSSSHHLNKNNPPEKKREVLSSAAPKPTVIKTEDNSSSIINVDTQKASAALVAGQEEMDKIVRDDQKPLDIETRTMRMIQRNYLYISMHAHLSLVKGNSRRIKIEHDEFESNKLKLSNADEELENTYDDAFNFMMHKNQSVWKLDKSDNNISGAIIWDGMMRNIFSNRELIAIVDNTNYLTRLHDYVKNELTSRPGDKLLAFRLIRIEKTSFHQMFVNNGLNIENPDMRLDKINSIYELLASFSEEFNKDVKKNAKKLKLILEENREKALPDAKSLAVQAIRSDSTLNLDFQYLLNGGALTKQMITEKDYPAKMLGFIRKWICEPPKGKLIEKELTAEEKFNIIASLIFPDISRADEKSHSNPARPQKLNPFPSLFEWPDHTDKDWGKKIEDYLCQKTDQNPLCLKTHNAAQHWLYLLLLNGSSPKEISNSNRKETAEALFSYIGTLSEKQRRLTYQKMIGIDHPKNPLELLFEASGFTPLMRDQMKEILIPHECEILDKIESLYTRSVRSLAGVLFLPWKESPESLRRAGDNQNNSKELKTFSI